MAARTAKKLEAVPGTGTPDAIAEIAPITLRRPQIATMKIPVRGLVPLIVHNWSEKARKEMLDKMQGRKVLRSPKDPEAEFESSMYRFEDGGHGFPTVGFKDATVMGGGRVFGKSVKMTELRIALTFQPDGISTNGMQLTRLITSGEPIMREDPVRLKMNAPDLRYRAEYRDWGAIITVSYIPSIIDAESVLALIDAGGRNGVGEWRPEKDGVFGTYEVDGNAEVSFL